MTSVYLDFLLWTILEVFIEFVTVLFLFYVLFLWLSSVPSQRLNPP